jgi:hypothetical protein
MLTPLYLKIAEYWDVFMCIVRVHIIYTVCSCVDYDQPVLRVQLYQVLLWNFTIRPYDILGYWIDLRTGSYSLRYQV